jgi:hypothetical protein
MTGIIRLAPRAVPPRWGGRAGRDRSDRALFRHRPDGDHGAPAPADALVGIVRHVRLLPTVLVAPLLAGGRRPAAGSRA